MMRTPHVSNQDIYLVKFPDLKIRRSQTSGHHHQGHISSRHYHPILVHDCSWDTLTGSGLFLVVFPCRDPASSLNICPVASISLHVMGFLGNRFLSTSEKVPGAWPTNHLLLEPMGKLTGLDGVLAKSDHEHPRLRQQKTRIFNIGATMGLLTILRKVRYGNAI